MRHRLRNPAQTSPSHVLGCVHARASARSNALRLLFALTLFVASTFSHAALVAVAPAGSDDFAVAPGWRAVDFNLFAASVGLLPAAELLPAATHVDLAGLGIGAGEAHAPPYEFEISDALSAAGLIDEFDFAARDVDGSADDAVYFAFTLIADADNAPVGKTPDGEQPMLPLDLFGLSVTAVLSRRSQTGASETLAEFLVVLEAADPDSIPDFTLDGVSHLPFFFVIDPTLLTPDHAASRDYRLQFALRDSAGNGYDLASDFSVHAVSTPGTASLLVPLFALCGAGLTRRSKRAPPQR